MALSEPEGSKKVLSRDREEGNYTFISMLVEASGCGVECRHSVGPLWQHRKDVMMNWTKVLSKK